MPDVIGAFVGHEQAERRRHQRTDVIEGAWTKRAEEGFQLREGELNRIEVRTVGRQEPEVRAGPLDREANVRLLVGREIVEHHHIARAQRGYEHLFDVGEKRRIVNRPIEDRRRRQLGRAQRGHHRVRLPVTARRVIRHAGAAGTAGVATKQISRDAGFVDEHILPRVVQWQGVGPPPPSDGHISAPLFVGVYGFF
jgi:hypothetical protein